jgi:type II secretory pathway component GspD/PulD (secretin)
VSIDATKTPIADVLRLLGQQTGINVIVDSAVEGVISLHVTDMAGRDALELIVAAAGMTYYWERGAVVVTTPQKLKASGAVQSVPLSVRHVRAGDLVAPLGALVGESNLEISPRGQQVIVTSTPDVIAEARQLVESMDRPLPQVAIEVRVVEIQSERLRELGISWSAQRLGSTLISGTFTPPPFASDPAGTAALSKATSTYELDVMLQALERRGHARILASPRLMTLGGQASRILIGDRVPYFTTQFNSDTGAREVIVEFVEVGIRLDLLPDVQADRSITTRIRTEISSIIDFRGPMQEIPWVKTREAETTVRVDRNQWVSLGGLITRIDRETVVSVPVLGDIPALGSLFQSRSSESVETEVVIMVSPTLVRS